MSDSTKEALKATLEVVVTIIGVIAMALTCGGAA